MVELEEVVILELVEVAILDLCFLVLPPFLLYMHSKLMNLIRMRVIYLSGWCIFNLTLTTRAGMVLDPGLF